MVKSRSAATQRWLLTGFRVRWCALCVTAAVIGCHHQNDVVLNKESNLRSPPPVEPATIERDREDAESAAMERPAKNSGASETKATAEQFSRQRMNAKALEGDGRFDEAVEQRRAILEFAIEHYGRAHWRTVTATVELERSQLYEQLSAADQKKVLRTYSLRRQAQQTARDGEKRRYAEIMQELLALRREFLPHGHIDIADGLLYYAEAWGYLGETKLSGQALEEALQIRETVLGEYHPGTAEVLYHLGIRSTNIGDFETAAAQYERAVRIYQRTMRPDSRDLLRTVAALADCLTVLGQYGRAQRLFDETLATGQRYRIGAVVGETTMRMAFFFWALEDRERAHELLTRAVMMGRSFGSSENPNVARALRERARVSMQLGKLGEAERDAREAAQIYETTVGRDSGFYTEAVTTLGRLLVQQGKFELAAAKFATARQIVLDVSGSDSPSLIDPLLGLANVDHQLGRHQEGHARVRRALQISIETVGPQHRDTAEIRAQVATSHLWLEDLTEARKAIHQALRDEITRADDVVFSLAESLALSYISSMHRHLGLALSIPATTGDQARDQYDLLWRLRGMVTRAVGDRRASYASSDEAREAWDQLVAARKRLAQLWWSKSSESATITEQLKRREELERQLAALSDQYRRRVSTEQSRVGDVVGRLLPGTAIVDIIRSNQYELPLQTGKPLASVPRYDAFIVTDDDSTTGYQVTRVSLGSAVETDELVDRWRAQLAPENGRGLRKTRQTSEEAESAVADALRKRIWEPIEAHLHGDSTVIMIPDGNLARLPWNALPDSTESQRLVHRYTIVLATYGQQIHDVIDRQVPISPRLVGVGGVDYDDAAAAGKPRVASLRSPPQGDERPVWSTLVASRPEVDAVQQMWGDTRSATVLSGKEATEAALSGLVPTTTVLHLATHGFFADERFRSAFFSKGGSLSRSRSEAVGRNWLLLSGIVLAGANRQHHFDELELPLGDDGILTGEEIVGWDGSNLDLVVLSACDTGLGNVASGEGVFGLQRAFHLAGARTTVASLWKVDDEAARELMTHFYRNLWEGKLPKCEALRQAQLALVDDDAPPGAWAAWILSGDWR